jgi:hypothetical protein
VSRVSEIEAQIRDLQNRRDDAIIHEFLNADEAFYAIENGAVQFGDGELDICAPAVPIGQLVAEWAAWHDPKHEDEASEMLALKRELEAALAAINAALTR